MSALDDTDGDGIDDATEGLIDSDSDGIPDYLDAMEASNVIQERRATSDSYVMETNPGLRLRLGSTALRSNIGASGVQSEDIETQQLQNPDSVTNVGGYFDFKCLNFLNRDKLSRSSWRNLPPFRNYRYTVN